MLSEGDVSGGKVRLDTAGSYLKLALGHDLVEEQEPSSSSHLGLRLGDLHLLLGELGLLEEQRLHLLLLPLAELLELGDNFRVRARRRRRLRRGGVEHADFDKVSRRRAVAHRRSLAFVVLVVATALLRR